MSHTPGPWHRHTAFPDRIIVNGSCVYQVRDMTTEDGFAGNGFGQPNPADTQLMATAPELLRQLKTMVDGAECDCEAVGYDHPLCDVCRSCLVIAKAEGRGE